MNLRATLNYKCFSSHQNKPTYSTVNKIFKNSNTCRGPRSATAANRSCKVCCELGESIDEFHEKSWRSPEGVVRCSANYVPLSPISFLERAADVYRDRTSVVYGSIKCTWEETHRRCLKLASVLIDLGVSRGDVVATFAPNVPAMIELHFAVPMAGAVICALNTRLDPYMLSTLLQHSESKILFVDYNLLHIAEEAVDLLKNTQSKTPIIVVISEPEFRCLVRVTGKYEYESVVNGGAIDFSVIKPIDECDPISLNYNSGTTSRSKGVVFSHRGAYLNSIASVFLREMREMPTYLWTIPMFHCNGWCFSWGVAMPTYLWMIPMFHCNGWCFSWREMPTYLWTIPMPRDQRLPPTLRPKRHLPQHRASPRHPHGRSSDGLKHDCKLSSHRSKTTPAHSFNSHRRNTSTADNHFKNRKSRVSRIPHLRPHGNIRPTNFQFTETRMGNIRS